MPDPNPDWMAAMRRGDHARAWAISDAVLAAREPATRDDPRLPYHLRWVWDGRPLRGRHVLVRCYHGLGDTLQFARFLAPLRGLVASLSVEVQPELLRLLERLPGPDRLIPFAADAPAAASECDLEIMELAHALRLPPEQVPPAALGIRIGPGRTGGDVGLCWEAGGWDPARSLPAGLLAPLFGARTVSLRPGRSDTLPFVNPEGCPRDIAAAAALIASLPLVITVDTMIAHLAGTLGVPTWLLLKHGADWRWLDGRADSPWYPSMRLYRQPAPGDWGAMVRQVANDLRAAGSRPAPSRPRR